MYLQAESMLSGMRHGCWQVKPGIMGANSIVEQCVDTSEMVAEIWQIYDRQFTTPIYLCQLLHLIISINTTRLPANR